MKIKPFLVGLVTTVDLVIIMVSFTLDVFRGSLFDPYAKRLDAWVSSGVDIKTVQSEVPERFGKLVLTQAGAFERIQLLTFFRDEFDFRVDVCLKMTANPVYKSQSLRSQKWSRRSVRCSA